MIFRTARQVVIAVIGGTVVLFGIALLVLPGPGTAFIFIGLAILATEFAWAAGLLKSLKKKAKDILSRRSRPKPSVREERTSS